MRRNFFSNDLPSHVLSISRIIQRCSKVEMIGSNARAISTFMKNPKSIFYFPLMNLPREFMGFFWRMASFMGHLSVPMSFRSSPIPTRFGLFYKSPKSFFRRYCSKFIVAWTASFIASQVMPQIYSAVKAVFSHGYNYITICRGLPAALPLCCMVSPA